MRYMVLIVFVVSMLSFIGCTENQRVRYFGGSSALELPVGTKFLHATWKNDSDIWYAYRKRHAGEPIDTVVFQQESSFNTLEGTITFVER